MNSKKLFYFGMLLTVLSTTTFANATAVPNYQANSSPELAIVKDSITAILKKPAATSESVDILLPVITNYERPIEEVIKEDNRIIESSVSHEVFPLDFKRLNPTAKIRKGKPQNCFSRQCCIKS